MQIINDLSKFDFAEIPIDDFWNTDSERELKMHKIHAYPAKFPSFITTKALAYANETNHAVGSIADIFCGCGTTALEAKRNNISYWGCDINPVATLIATVKSSTYKKSKVVQYLTQIVDAFYASPIEKKFESANERLTYWFDAKSYNHLYQLKKSIADALPPNSKYRAFFLCAFSNILKPASRWLTKSIKPQIDPHKQSVHVMHSFMNQCYSMIAAMEELGQLKNPQSKIVTANILAKKNKAPVVDMIITSPPYVTSYEYADLHQLSTLWLEFVKDHRDLREGTIGSLYHDDQIDYDKLNDIGKSTVEQLAVKDRTKSRSVAKYFLDMQAVSAKTYNMLDSSGLALFVIGNTEYKDVRMDNAKHLAESLICAGFTKIMATKRKISNKILTPYRTAEGKFTTDKTGKKIYSEEFILIGVK